VLPITTSMYMPQSVVNEEEEEKEQDPALPTASPSDVLAICNDVIQIRLGQTPPLPRPRRGGELP